MFVQLQQANQGFLFLCFVYLRCVFPEPPLTLHVFLFQLMLLKLFFLNLFIKQDANLCFWLFSNNRNIVHIFSRQCDEFRFLHTWVNNPFIDITIISFRHSIYFTKLQFQDKYLLVQTIQRLDKKIDIKISSSFNDKFLVLTLAGLTGYSTGDD